MKTANLNIQNSKLRPYLDQFLNQTGEINKVFASAVSPVQYQRFPPWRYQCVPSQSNSPGCWKTPPASPYWCHLSLRRAWQTRWSLSCPRGCYRSSPRCDSSRLAEAQTEASARRFPLDVWTKFSSLTVETSSIAEWYQLSDDLSIILVAIQPSAQYKMCTLHTCGCDNSWGSWMYSHCNHLLQGNATAWASACPSSLTITLLRNQPQPPPLPLCPILTLWTCPIATASTINSSNWTYRKQTGCQTVFSPGELSLKIQNMFDSKLRWIKDKKAHRITLNRLVGKRSKNKAAQEEAE